MKSKKKLPGPGWWGPDKKIEVVTTYLTLGNAPMVEAVTGVPRGTIRQWKMMEWWKELESQIRNEEDAELDVKLSKVINKSLDAVLDRVDNGDFIFDSKTSKFHRKPVHMRDALKAVTEVYDKRQLLRGKPTSRVEKQTIQDNLAKLAAEFIKFSKSKTIEGEVIDAERTGLQEELQTGTQDGSKEGRSQRPSFTEQSPSSVDAGR